MQIPNTIKDQLRPVRDKLRNSIFPGHVSYSQAGEDMIIRVAFSFMGILKPTYLDIGANDPKLLSNTYYFYRKGQRGVCVEANPKLCRRLRRTRKRDICLNVAIGTEEQDGSFADFYVLSSHEISTFSKVEADRCVALGIATLEAIIPIQFMSLNRCIRENLRAAPDLLSIDVEGMDLQILKSLDFAQLRPAAICVETIDFHTQAKDQDIIDYLKSQDYTIFGDTCINTIFVDSNRWHV